MSAATAAGAWEARRGGASTGRSRSRPGDRVVSSGAVELRAALTGLQDDAKTGE